jgi:hypothetical protein
MAIDISILTAALQAKIDALDSNSAISDIVALERAAQQFGTTTYYDSDGDLPEATYFPKQSIVSTYSPPTVNRASKLYINNFGTWKEIQTFKTQIIIPYGGSNFGYTAGGWQTPGNTTQIRKFPFASDTTATNVGNISATAGAYYNNTGVANSQGPQGYIFGNSSSSTIDTFTYSSDTIGSGGPSVVLFTPPGSTLNQIGANGGMNNDESGFIAGYYGGTRIKKFDFASGTPIVTSDWGVTPSAITNMVVTGSATSNKVDNKGFVLGGGDLVDVSFSSANVSVVVSEGNYNNIYRKSADTSASTTHGYVSGGLESPGISSLVDKFSFASYVETNVGASGQPWAHRFGQGHSSVTDGYTAGGADSGKSHIVKYPFSSDTGIAARVNGLGTNIGQAAPLFY